jgi:hypothetical protein
MSAEIEREVTKIIAALDKERAKGFCDEYGILRLWASDLVKKVEARYDIGHREAVARARTCEGALEQIVSNPSLTRQKMLVIAGNAASKAKRLRFNVN